LQFKLLVRYRIINLHALGEQKDNIIIGKKK
jgi:hypothetical protein